MRSPRLWDSAAGLVLAALVVTTAACGGGSPESAAPGDTAPAAGATKIDPATVGNVKGVVALNGTAPANAIIRMNADPMCLRTAKGEQTQETFKVGADGKSLANVFVYVKDGLGNYIYDTPTTPVTLNQEGCRYLPHVFGIRVGQPLEIVNSDPTLHNIHATPKVNQEFNNGQPIQGMKTPHTFTAKEVMVPFKCDVHGWMNAYAGVLDHPFFAVTDENGAFSISGLPAGTYTLEAWHEKLGAITQSVTVAANETKDVTFTMNAAAAATD